MKTGCYEGNVVALPLKTTDFQKMIVLNGSSVDASLLMDDFLFIQVDKIVRM